MSASIKQEIIEQLDKLPIELQRRVLDFTHALVMSEKMAKTIREGYEQVDRNVITIERLMEIYENSRLNKEEPECIFAETLIFNEGWLLRGVLQKWISDKCQSKEFPFLPFPIGAKIYSEAQLYTPFKKWSRDDKQGEYNTHVDGIVGDFSFPNSKSGIVLNSCKYLTIFEAKLYSGLSSEVEHAKNYSQVSRTIACIINAVYKLKTENSDNSIHFIVIYPNDNEKINPEKFTKCFIEGEIQERLTKYAGKIDCQFKEQWKDILKDINIHFITWECLLSEFKDQRINRFYELCKKFNRYYQ